MMTRSNLPNPRDHVVSMDSVKLPIVLYDKAAIFVKKLSSKNYFLLAVLLYYVRNFIYFLCTSLLCALDCHNLLLIKIAGMEMFTNKIHASDTLLKYFYV